MKFSVLVLTTITLSLLMAVAANPGVAIACGKVLGTS